MPFSASPQFHEPSVEVEVLVILINLVNKNRSAGDSNADSTSRIKKDQGIKALKRMVKQTYDWVSIATCKWPISDKIVRMTST